MGCYFHESGYLWNRCNYFEMEYFCEPEDCKAFSIDGYISPENELDIYEETDGVFGKMDMDG